MKNETGCNEYKLLTSRRDVLKGATVAGVIASIAPAWLPRVAYASSENTARDIIVSIYLRGGCDGLTMCVPYGDPAYATRRNQTRILPPGGSPNEAVDLDGFFGLPKGLQALKPIYDQGDFLIVHATGSPSSNRSHFDAQYYMEVGEPGNKLTGTGWLGRHLAMTAPTDLNAVLRAMSFSSGLALTITGGSKTLPIPDPTNYNLSGQSGTRAARLNALVQQYSTDEILNLVARDTQQTISLLASIGFSTYAPAGGAVYATDSLARSLRSTAALVRANVGVEAFHIDYGGWDTHSEQGVVSGSMFTTMSRMANALNAFYTDLKAAGFMNKVTVVIVSEFGRTVRENGSFGTDHGHGNVIMMMGENVIGGRVFSRGGSASPLNAFWPGLADGQLYQNQDIHVTTDFRDVLGELVSKRLSNPNVAQIFPNYAGTFYGLVDA